MEEIRWEGQNFSEVVAPREEEEEEEDEEEEEEEAATKDIIFWGVMLCNLVVRYQQFDGISFYTAPIFCTDVGGSVYQTTWQYVCVMLTNKLHLIWYVFHAWKTYHIRCMYNIVFEPGNVVGIATGYGLHDPGIESRWGARFSASV
jgi:hypothetical protein